MACFTIKGRNILPQSTPYIIAEISGNHGGKEAKLLMLIDAAYTE